MQSRSKEIEILLLCFLAAASLDASGLPCAHSQHERKRSRYVPRGQHGHGQCVTMTIAGVISHWPSMNEGLTRSDSGR